eukprot:3566930-Amphidinium_carterae.2
MRGTRPGTADSLPAESDPEQSLAERVGRQFDLRRIQQGWGTTLLALGPLQQHAPPGCANIRHSALRHQCHGGRAR